MKDVWGTELNAQYSKVPAVTYIMLIMWFSVLLTACLHLQISPLTPSEAEADAIVINH